MKILLFAYILLLPFTAMAAADFSPVNELSGERREYYINTFNHWMDNSKANETHNWKAHGAEGRIRASEKYLSKSEAVCRNYTETFEIDGKKGENSGVACKRGGEPGWCRLKEEDAHTCAMEKPPSGMDRMWDDTKDSLNKAKNMLGF